MRQLNCIQEAALIRLSVEGKTRPEIAREIGCCNTTVWSYQRRLGLL